MISAVRIRAKSLARKLLPLTLRRGLARYSRWPPVGRVRFGTLRRLTPIGAEMGDQFGQPIDRYYIDRFLSANAATIHGHVLEIGTDLYTRTLGNSRVVKSDVLHVAEDRPNVTIIEDLTKGDKIPSDSFDCIILTQTLQFIYDVPAALQTVARILKPGGTLLATIPGISQISRYDMDRWGHYWSFTTLSTQKLFEADFPKEYLQINSHGNVLSATAFLHGMISSELALEELNYVDPDYQLLITVKAVKPVLRS